jgi:hypothetical protein
MKVTFSEFETLGAITQGSSLTAEGAVYEVLEILERADIIDDIQPMVELHFSTSPLDASFDDMMQAAHRSVTPEA